MALRLTSSLGRLAGTVCRLRGGIINGPLFLIRYIGKATFVLCDDATVYLTGPWNVTLR